MGRPEDEFVRKHAEKSENGWKCNYCNREFKKTSVSRMRDHLSGQGDTNISGCEEVPNKVADEALEKINKKRARKSSEGEVNDNVIVANIRGNSKDPLTQRAHEEHVTDALVKFFLCKKVTVSPYFMDDPNFKQFLKRVHQYGVPSGLLNGHTLAVEKSLLNIRDDVNQYMSEVMKSWKTTGCTLIGFSPKDMKVKSSDVSKDKFAVLGFYSPKGFIFFEGPNITRYPDCDNLEIHLPTLDIDLVTVYVMTHLCEEGCEGCLSSCEFSDMNICDWINNLDYEKSTCVCHDMQDICIDVCKESEWAQRLIKKAEEIHSFFFDSSLHLRRDYYKALKEKGFKGFPNGKHASSLSCFLALMMFEKYELESLGRSHGDMAFLDDSNFWSAGKILNSVLICLLEKIPRTVDTLIPTASYVWEIISYVERWKLDDLDVGFREALKSKLRDTYEYLYTAAYLNPRYFNKVGKDERLKLIEAIKEGWIYDDFLYDTEEEPNNEVERYNSKISKSDAYFCNSSHPVKWWQEKGGDYPILQKIAIEVLSRPVSCMCNQVKKHFVHLEGADDYILRLNVRMMEEYKRLGDDIYKPIDLHLSFHG